MWSHSCLPTIDGSSPVIAEEDADAAGAFALTFKRETDGSIRSRVFFDQPMRGGRKRTLRRQVDAIAIARSELQL